MHDLHRHQVACQCPIDQPGSFIFQSELSPTSAPTARLLPPSRAAPARLDPARADRSADARQRSTLNWRFNDPANSGTNGTRNVLNVLHPRNTARAYSTRGVITVDHRLTAISRSTAKASGACADEHHPHDNGPRSATHPDLQPYYPAGAPSGLRNSYHLAWSGRDRAAYAGAALSARPEHRAARDGRCRSVLAHQRPRGISTTTRRVKPRCPRPWADDRLLLPAARRRPIAT